MLQHNREQEGVVVPVVDDTIRSIERNSFLALTSQERREGVLDGARSYSPSEDGVTQIPEMEEEVISSSPGQPLEEREPAMIRVDDQDHATVAPLPRRRRKDHPAQSLPSKARALRKKSLYNWIGARLAWRLFFSAMDASAACPRRMACAWRRLWPCSCTRRCQDHSIAPSRRPRLASVLPELEQSSCHPSSCNPPRVIGVSSDVNDHLRDLLTLEAGSSTEAPLRSQRAHAFLSGASRLPEHQAVQEQETRLPNTGSWRLFSVDVLAPVAALENGDYVRLSPSCPPNVSGETTNHVEHSRFQRIYRTIFAWIFGRGSHISLKIRLVDGKVLLNVEHRVCGCRFLDLALEFIPSSSEDHVDTSGDPTRLLSAGSGEQHDAGWRPHIGPAMVIPGFGESPVWAMFGKADSFRLCTSVATSSAKRVLGTHSLTEIQGSTPSNAPLHQKSWLRDHLVFYSEDMLQPLWFVEIWFERMPDAAEELQHRTPSPSSASAGAH